MFMKNLKLKVNVLATVSLITTLVVVSGATQNFASAQIQKNSTPTPTPGQSQAVLTIVVRDSMGNPLEGLVCEVLSYGWGLQINEAYAIIARGETDKNGVVAFDDSRWPNSGYRFKFSPTDHLKPPNTYILPDSDNQYRGFPGAVVGGRTETQRFVLSGSDSVFYNDISKEGQLPEYQRDTIAGMEKPRVSVMDGADYLATAIAATLTAEARGEPTPTIPAPPSPSPRPGEVQPALTVTPGQALTAAAAKTAGSAIKPATTPTAKTPTVLATTTSGAQTTTVVVAQAVPSPSLTAPGGFTGTAAIRTSGSSQATTEAASTDPDKTGTSPNGSNLFVSIMLAILGIGCLVLFWRFRFSIYPLFGIEASPRKKINSRLTALPVKTRPQRRASQKPEDSTSQTEQDSQDVE